MNFKRTKQNLTKVFDYKSCPHPVGTFKKEKTRSDIFSPSPSVCPAQRALLKLNTYKRVKKCAENELSSDICKSLDIVMILLLYWRLFPTEIGE